MRGEEDVACGIRSTSSTVCTPSGTHAYVKKWFEDSMSTTWIVLTVGCIASQLELGLSLSASKGEACRCLSERPSFSFLAFISVRENEGRRALGRLAEDETPWDDLGQTVCPRASVAKVTRNASALERSGNSLVWIFLLHKAREECYDPLLCSFLDFLLAPQKALGQEQDDIFQNETVKQGKARQGKAWLVAESSSPMTGLAHRMEWSQDTSRARTERKGCRIHITKAAENCLRFYSGEP